MTEALFEPVAPGPLRLPRLLVVDQGPVAYANYAPKHPVRCEDCVVVLYEANKSGESAPPARQARFKRTQGNTKLLLCAEHKNLRTQAEGS